METGYLLDNTQGGYAAGTWVSGLPERNMWTGLKLKGRTQLSIITYRCTRCGYLESYAPSPDAPENSLLRPAQAEQVQDKGVQLLRAGTAPDTKDND